MAGPAGLRDVADESALGRGAVGRTCTPWILATEAAVVMPAAAGMAEVDAVTLAKSTRWARSTDSFAMVAILPVGLQTSQ